MHEILPLFSVFESLRQNDFPLGMGEYEKFLAALRQFTGLSLDDYALFVRKLQQEPAAKTVSVYPKQQLLRLVKLMWLKPGQSEQLFEDLFEENYAHDFTLPKDNQTPVQDTNQSAAGATNGTSTSERQQDKDVEDEQMGTEEEGQRDYQLDEEAVVSQSGSARIAVSERNPSRQIGIEDDHKPETEKSKFLFTRNYYPIDNRKLYQSFKQYPTYRNFLLTSEVDIEATINRTLEYGFFNEIVFRKHKVSLSHLLLLVDNRGSMVAFEPLVDAIDAGLKNVFRASKAPTSKNLMTLYFNNMPDGVYYENKMHTTAVDFNKILGTLKNKPAGIIIISDAGAARMSYNIRRVTKTNSLIKKLKGYTKNIAWLNPLSEERWQNTSAEGIAAAVAMFVANEKGIKSAVDFLKGSVSKKLDAV